MASASATGRLAERTTELLIAAVRTEETTRTEHAARVTLPADAPGVATSPAPGLPTLDAQAAAAGAALSPVTGRIERTLALVERIERFVRSGRPSLALTLRGGIRGHLVVERVGPGAVSLRLSSPRPPSASELGDLRHALEARGLSVRSLEARPRVGESGERASVLTASAGDACSPCP